MHDYITLMGSENVVHGGNAIRDGGQSMLSAASQIDESMRRQQIFMDDWLIRFEQILQDNRIELSKLNAK